MDAPRPASSLADQAYGQLRADILNGRFKPGIPLRLEALKEMYGFSFTPMREALTRLRGDGLVTQTSLRGFRTAELSREEMWDILDMRIFIECEAVGRSIEHGDVQWESLVVASLHAFVRHVEKGVKNAEDRELFETRHGDFHRSLIAACGSPSLLRLAHNFWLLSERYRRPHLFRYADPSVLLEEHEQLSQAVLDRDTARARSLLKKHYTKTGKLVETKLLATADENRGSPDLAEA